MQERFKVRAQSWQVVKASVPFDAATTVMLGVVNTLARQSH
jgi:hypothetical protein